MSTVDDRAKMNFRQSGDCIAGGHAGCSGRRFVGWERGNVPVYGRCQCECHKSAAVLRPPTPEGDERAGE